MMYAIVDLETTGAFSGKHKITEVAIVHFDGEIVVDRFESLINPERSIPQSIEQFTGISNAMVMNAPPFYKMAKEIVERLDQCVFVAHNVSFDYGVLRSEFTDLGYNFNSEKLCTVRLSRKAFPGQDSYSLGKLCKSLDIPLKNRHRAMGDANATTILLSKILNTLDEKEINDQQQQDKLLLPPQLDKETVENLPEACGIYFFKDENDETVYIGKSKNIRSRVKQHFRFKNGNRKSQKLREHVHSVDCIITEYDLCARILECDLIKKNRPKFNRSLNRVKLRYGLLLEKNENNFLSPVLRTPSRFGVNRHEKALYFYSKHSAQKAIAKIYQDAFGLNYESFEFPKLHNVFLNSLKSEQYNQKISKAFLKNFYPYSNFDVVIGRQLKKRACISFRNEAIEKITFFHGDAVYEEYALDENLDIRNIFLAEYRKKNMDIIIHNESTL